jgi:glyoxylase I family protein
MAGKLSTGADVTRGFVHHIDLTVTQLDRSRAFYDHLLTYLGYVRTDDHAHGTDWDMQVSDGFCSIGIVQSKGTHAARPHDRFTAGLHHMAWTAESRADVDRLHAQLVERDTEILDGPAIFPEYGPTYYAVFFTDPDGLKLEFVFSGS